MSGMVPPKRFSSRNLKKALNAKNPLDLPATRRDIFQVTKAMMATWRAIDDQLDYFHALAEWQALPFWRRYFTAKPVAPGVDVEPEGKTANPADITIDESTTLGDTSTATSGDGPESEDEL